MGTLVSGEWVLSDTVGGLPLDIYDSGGYHYQIRITDGTMYIDNYGTGTTVTGTTNKGSAVYIKYVSPSFLFYDSSNAQISSTWFGSPLTATYG